MIQLLGIDNVVAVDTGVDFGQLVVAAVGVDDFLDLLGVELLVGEDGQIRGDGADNTVAAEDFDAILMTIQGANKVIDIGGFILRETGSAEGVDEGEVQ